MSIKATRNRGWQVQVGRVSLVPCCAVLCGVHALAASARVQPPVAACTLWHLQGTILNHFDLRTIGIRVNCRAEFYRLKKCITVLAPLAGLGRKDILGEESVAD